MGTTATRNRGALHWRSPDGRRARSQRWKGEHMVPCVQRKHWEELKEQVSEMEEYGGGGGGTRRAPHREWRADRDAGASGVSRGRPRDRAGLMRTGRGSQVYDARG